MFNNETIKLYEAIGLASPESDLDRVQSAVNMLITGLYTPAKTTFMQKVDITRLQKFGINNSESINWADLKCIDVQKFEDGSYLVVIDKVNPNNCKTFCNYISDYMLAYGWDVKVVTEW